MGHKGPEKIHTHRNRGNHVPTYGYARVSTSDQVRGASLEEQEQRIRGIALARGTELDRLFVEAGFSGSARLEDRPVGADLLRLLRGGDTVIVAKLDRAFRNAADALATADQWRQQQIHLIVVDMGADPVTGNGVAKLFFGMLAVVAEFERARILERTNDGRRAKAARGGHIGGSAPFGYRVEGTGRDARLVAVPEEQAALRTIRECRGQLSLRGTAELVRSTHGLQISHEVVRRVIGSEQVAPQ